jgi:DNA-binding protein H-NS
MATLLQLQKQMSQLQTELDRVRRAEAHTVIARMQKDIATYGITAEDLGFVGASSTSASTPAAPVAKRTRGPNKKAGAPLAGEKAPSAAKFRDPKSGKTWTGRGKPPLWIAGKKDRTPFLIASTDAPSVTVSEAAPVPMKKSAKRVAAKKVTRRAASAPADASVTAAPVPAKKAAAKKADVKKAGPKKAAMAKKAMPAKKSGAAAKKPVQATKKRASKAASNSANATANASAKGRGPKVTLSKAALALSQPEVDPAQGTLPLDASAA